MTVASLDEQAAGPNAPSLSRSALRDGATRIWREAFGALAVVALFELAVLRLGTRTFINIPGLDAIAGPLSATSAVARFAYYVSVSLLVVALVVGAAALTRSRTAQNRTAVAGVVLFFAAGLAGLAGQPAVSAVVTLSAVMLVLPAAALGSRRRQWVLGLYVAAFVALGLHALVQISSQAGYGTASTTWLIGLGEICGVAFAVSTPWLASSKAKPSHSDSRVRPHIDSWALGGGIVVAGVVAGLGISGTSTGQILSLWNFGLAAFLPGPLYVVAAGALAYAGISLLRTGERGAAAALALVAAAGIGLHSTYQSGLAVAGLVLFALSVPDCTTDGPAGASPAEDEAT